MIITANTLTSAQEEAVEQLRVENLHLDLLLDMPRISGGDAWVYTEGDVDLWRVTPTGSVEYAS